MLRYTYLIASGEQATDNKVRQSVTISCRNLGFRDSSGIHGCDYNHLPKEKHVEPTAKVSYLISTVASIHF